MIYRLLCQKTSILVNNKEEKDVKKVKRESDIMRKNRRFETRKKSTYSKGKLTAELESKLMKLPNNL